MAQAIFFVFVAVVVFPQPLRSERRAELILSVRDFSLLFDGFLQVFLWSWLQASTVDALTLTVKYMVLSPTGTNCF